VVVFVFSSSFRFLLFLELAVVGTLLASSPCIWFFLLLLIYSAILLPSFRKKTSGESLAPGYIVIKIRDSYRLEIRK
jgi:hypothetical protein